MQLASWHHKVSIFWLNGKNIVGFYNAVMMLICAGHLQANRPSIGSASSYQHVFFKMDVPKAQNVAVVVGTAWTQLEQKEPGSWHGEVLCHNYLTLFGVLAVILTLCHLNHE